MTFQGGSAGEGSIPIAKLTLIHEFEFTAAELDVSVVQRLFHNQLRRVTQCYNMVFLSLRRYSEVEGVALEILLAHVKLLLLIPKMLMTRLPMRRQGNTARAELSQKFRDLDFVFLLQHLRVAHARESRSGGSVSNAARALKFVHQGRLSSAAKALKTTTLTPSTDEAARKEIQAKFPAKKGPEDGIVLNAGPVAQNADETLPQITVDDIRRVAHTVNKHTAAGPSGSPMFAFVTPLRIANPTKHDDDFAGHIAWLANQMQAGAAWTGGLCSDVRLVAIKEANGRNRPIQIAEALDRLIGKVLFLKHRPGFLQRFGALQQGMNPSGMERTVLMMDSLLQDHKDSVLLTTDLANAFNEVSRDFIESELRRHLPAALPYFRLRYSGATQVRFGDFLFCCSEGVRQGCPWSGALFCLALMPALETLQAKYADRCYVRAAFDDISILVVDPAEARVSELLTDLAQEVRQLGMELRLGKCALYGRHREADSALPATEAAAISKLPRRDPDVTSLRCIPSNKGLVLLGTPIGSPQYVSRECRRLVEAVTNDMRDLSLLEDHPQEYFLLLRHCFNARPQYLARTVRPDLLLRAAKAFDHQVNRRIAEHLAGLQVGRAVQVFDDFAAPFKRARLPYALGGFQIPSLQMTSRAGYAAALATSWDALPKRRHSGVVR